MMAVSLQNLSTPEDLLQKLREAEINGTDNEAQKFKENEVDVEATEGGLTENISYLFGGSFSSQNLTNLSHTLHQSLKHEFKMECAKGEVWTQGSQKIEGNCKSLSQTSVKELASLQRPSTTASQDEMDEGAESGNCPPPAKRPIQTVMHQYAIKDPYLPNSIPKKRLDNKLLKMMVKDMQPYNIVNDEGFREFVYASALALSFALTSLMSLKLLAVPDSSALRP
ncbi:hypothetical protein QQF64_001477 [Cirrhinus molitorella]|uniref:Uncharacterized protein n=1 Tax=Cirrhinus molitorella TaxID=172907 RepID=A0ABR3P063_9TELE